jgi:hypothetical protein
MGKQLEHIGNMGKTIGQILEADAESMEICSLSPLCSATSRDASIVKVYCRQVMEGVFLCWEHHDKLLDFEVPSGDLLLSCAFFGGKLTEKNQGSKTKKDAQSNKI